MDTTLLSIIASIAAALGIKELWTVWKKKIDLKANAQSDEKKLSTKVFFAVIENLKEDIKELEERVEQLTKENKEYAIKLARMEERLVTSAKSKAKRKITVKKTT